MLKTTVLFLLFVISSHLSNAAQVDIRVLSQTGSTLYDRVNNAQALCPSLPDTCNLIFEVYIPKHPGEILPSMCSNCTWADSRIIHEPPSGAGVSSGGIVFISSGSCPTGYTEFSTTGKYLLFTTTAGADVGTNGGSLNYTPAGSNSTPTFTGTSSQSTSSVSAGTPAGTIASQTFTGTLQTFTTASNVSLLGVGAALVSPTSITPAGSISTGAFTGSALGTHSHTLTPAGTNTAPTFSGSAATIQPTYLKLIGCQKD